MVIKYGVSWEFNKSPGKIFEGSLKTKTIPGKILHYSFNRRLIFESKNESHSGKDGFRFNMVIENIHLNYKSAF